MTYIKTNLFFLVFFLFLANCSQAQVIPDNTLPEKSTVDSDCATTCQVGGGTTRDGNLFHSFEQFSVPTKGEVTFKNNPQIENIFTRVTGSSISDIDGVIRAQGSANLFLINPHGIIFGNNAQLDVGGSFLATTAESIFFADKSQFSTANPQASALLTVSVPIGLQFGETPGAIVNKSQVQGDFFPIGLKVDDGKTLALVGNGVTLDGGALTAFEGRIELGSVGANSFVDIEQNAESFSLSYDSVNRFADISLINQSLLFAHDTFNTSLPSSGIQIYGNSIEVNNSEVAVRATGTGEIGKLNIQAQDLILGRGTLITETGSGDQGNIILSNLNTLFMYNESQITTIYKKRGGTGGNINIDSNSIFLLDKSRITANALEGEGGNIFISTQRLIQQPSTEIHSLPKMNSPYNPISSVIELIDIETILTGDLCRLEEGKIAQGSSFIITGRGGLTPTAEDSLDDVDNVVRWANPQSIQVSQDGLVGVSQRSLPKKAPPEKKLNIQQSRGWVKTADGSVWLVTNSPNSIPQNSQVSSHNCQTF